jgi:hypothetical protein
LRSLGLIPKADAKRLINFDPEIPDSNVSLDKQIGRTGEHATKAGVLILGMHRSGTSSLAGALIWLGGAAPLHLMPPTEDNKRGYWESTVLTALNDDILAALGSEWRDWRQLDFARMDRVAAAAFSARAMMALATEFEDSVLPVVKDPRLCRLIPFWSSVFQQSEWSVRPILQLRSPLEVARSLHRRDGIPLSWGCLLWLRYVLDAEVETRDTSRAVLHWDEFLRNPRRALASLGETLSLTWPRWSDAALDDVDAYVSADLRRQKADDEGLRIHPAVSNLVRETYDAMIALVDDPYNATLLRTLDHCRARFNDSAAVFDRAMFEVEQKAWHMFEIDARRGYESLIGTTKQEFANQIAAERTDFANRLNAAKEEFATQIAAERSDFASTLNAAKEEFATQIAAERSDFASTLNAAKEEFASQIAAERSDFVGRLDAMKKELASQIDSVKKESAGARVEDAIAYMVRRHPRKGKGVVTWFRDCWQAPSKVRKQIRVIRASPLFDEDYYLSSNPDVSAAGVDPWLHYLLHGAHEGRDPSPLFSTSQYLAQNQDVAASGVNALVHYETDGRRENRKPVYILG